MLTIHARRVSLLCVVALVSLLPADAFGGFVFVDERGAQLLLQKGRVKHVSPGAEEPVVAVDAAKARLWISNPRARAYWEGTIDEFCGAVKGMLAGVSGGAGAGGALPPEVEKALREQMASLPPEQQAMVRQMLQARQGQAAATPPAPPPRVTVEPTSDTEQVAGLTARKFRVLADGKLYEEVWVSNDPAIVRELDLTGAPETIAKLSACQLGQSRVHDTPAYRQLYTQGWPLKSVSHAGGFSRPVIVKTERRDMPDAEFAPPADYRKLTLTEVLMKR